MGKNDTHAPRLARSCALFWIVAVLLVVALLALIQTADAYFQAHGWGF